jgi:murein L,D-transpeptidase YafK
LRSGDVSFIGDGSNVSVVVADKKNATSNSWDATLGTTDKVFKVNFRIDNFKMLDGDYVVSISKKRISKFASKMNDLTYFIAVEADSTFDF